MAESHIPCAACRCRLWRLVWNSEKQRYYLRCMKCNLINTVQKVGE